MYDNIICIPFRNRDEQLKHFINNTVPLIQKHLPNTLVLVIEQNEGKLFNRGALLNVGFKEYKNQTRYFFTHDVDLNPTHKCINEFYSKEVKKTDVLGIYTSQHNTLGGIIKINNETIHKINGFPNDYWGWGAEDKALQNRTEYHKIKKITNLTNAKEHPMYLLRFNDVNDRVTKNHHMNNKKNSTFKKLTDKEQKQQILSSGINNLQYTVLERKMIHDIVEIIKVDILYIHE